MVNKKLLLTIQDLKELGLLNKKKKKRKRTYTKLKNTVLTPNIIGGFKSDSFHLTGGFGTQINRTNDLYNENVRLQNSKLLDTIKNGDTQNKSLLALTNEYQKTKEDLNNFKLQASQYADHLQKTILLRNNNDDAVDVPSSGGSAFFDTMGDPNKLVDHHPNENKAMYAKSEPYDVEGMEANINNMDANLQSLFASPEMKAGTKISKPISKMSTEELSDQYLYLGGESDISGLTKKEKYTMVQNLTKKFKPVKLSYGKKAKY